MTDTVVALSIFGVISLMAVPSASISLRRYRFIAAANQIAFDITRARMQAVGQNLFVRIRFSDTSHYVRERSTDGVTYVADDVTAALPSGIAAPNAPTTTFNRNGMAVVSTRVNVTDGRGTKEVYTNILGRVTIS